MKQASRWTMMTARVMRLSALAAASALGALIVVAAGEPRPASGGRWVRSLPDPIRELAPGLRGAPAVAFDGANYFVVWEDYRSGGDGDVYGARVGQDGTVLDPEGIPISTAGNNQLAPGVSFDGTNYLVVWQDLRSDRNYEIYGARVSPDGDVLDGSGIAISTGGTSHFGPTAAFDGTNYLVVWTDGRAETDVYGARVSRDGTVLDPAGIPISTASNDQVVPSVAFDGTNYLVVWQDRRPGTTYDIYGARVGQGVAFDGMNYLVAWQDNRFGGSEDVYGARVSRAGDVLDASGIPVSTAANAQLQPAVAFGGANSFVAWTDTRSGSDPDIYGARVSPGGSVLDPDGILITVTAPVPPPPPPPPPQPPPPHRRRRGQGSSSTTSTTIPARTPTRRTPRTSRPGSTPTTLRRQTTSLFQPAPAGTSAASLSWAPT